VLVLLIPSCLWAFSAMMLLLILIFILLPDFYFPASLQAIFLDGLVN
jgi:hypothetical protein